MLYILDTYNMGVTTMLKEFDYRFPQLMLVHIHTYIHTYIHIYIYIIKFDFFLPI